MSTAAATAHITDIPALLQEKITKDGPISVAEYMATCLYTPGLGYYLTRDPFGAEGDFTTAPEISQLFGEMLAVWVMDSWHRAGRPTPFMLLELGPGRGTLMADMLRTIKQVMPECYAAMQVTMVEISTLLKRQQRRSLQPYLNKIDWADDLSHISSQTYCLCIGNEFLDALPVQQFVRKNGSYYEQLIGLASNGTYSFAQATEPTSLPNHYTAEQVEVIPALSGVVNQLKRIIQRGAVLFIDYGAEAQGHTLQAVQRHKYVDIFHQPGNSDLTAQVDFSAVAHAFGDGSQPLMTMADFLTAMGFATRASQLMQVATPLEKEEIQQAAARLLHPEQMGTLFKAFIWLR